MKIFGHDIQDVLDAQQRKGRLVSNPVDVHTPGDYGADPVGNGMFKMVPSGDVVDLAERNRRLDARKPAR